MGTPKTEKKKYQQKLLAIKFLGTGNAFVNPITEKNFHSSVLIFNRQDSLLIDVGSNIPTAIEHYQIPLEKINKIFITHLHGDHCHGLEEIGFKTYFSEISKPTIFINKKLSKKLWDNVLSGTMSKLNSRENSMNDYFQVEELAPRSGFELKKLNLTFFPTKVPHVISDEDEEPAYGLKWTIEGYPHFKLKTKFPEKTNVFFTGDTQFDYWRHFGNYEWADLIFHDCEFKEYSGGVHAQFHQLEQLPEETKSKIFLYHYSTKDFKNYGYTTIEEMDEFVKSKGFAGLVKPGQEFKFTQKENKGENEDEH